MPVARGEPAVDAVQAEVLMRPASTSLRSDARGVGTPCTSRSDRSASASEVPRINEPTATCAVVICVCQQAARLDRIAGQAMHYRASHERRAIMRQPSAGPRPICTTNRPTSASAGRISSRTRRNAAPRERPTARRARPAPRRRAGETSREAKFARRSARPTRAARTSRAPIANTPSPRWQRQPLQSAGTRIAPRRRGRPPAGREHRERHGQGEKHRADAAMQLSKRPLVERHPQAAQHALEDHQRQRRQRPSKAPSGARRNTTVTTSSDRRHADQRAQQPMAMLDRKYPTGRRTTSPTGKETGCSRRSSANRAPPCRRSSMSPVRRPTTAET